jgi:hypothetical protein
VVLIVAERQITLPKTSQACNAKVQSSILCMVSNVLLMSVWSVTSPVSFYVVCQLFVASCAHSRLLRHIQRAFHDSDGAASSQNLVVVALRAQIYVCAADGASLAAISF